LREELKTLTGQRGAKAALADACGVTPQAVSAWLREEYSPEASTVLWLLRWVENPQRSFTSTKNPAAEATATGSETQSKGHHTNEAQRKGRKKK
jgi:transcriptional regulator with XRE-family HTH domain